MYGIETKKRIAQKEDLNKSITKDFIDVINHRNNEIKIEIERWVNKINNKKNEINEIEEYINVSYNNINFKIKIITLLHTQPFIPYLYDECVVSFYIENC